MCSKDRGHILAKKCTWHFSQTHCALHFYSLNLATQDDLG